MRQVDAWASLPHYADHIAPIWQAIPPSIRGSFAATRSVKRHRDVTARAPDTTGHPVIVASSSDMRRVGGRPVIFVEHGAGQTYEPHPSYAGGPGREAVRLFICASESTARLNRERYPDTPIAVVGSHRVEWLRGARESLVVPPTRTPPAPLTLALSFHWDCHQWPEARSAYGYYRNQLPGIIRSWKAKGYRVLGHGHPRAWGALRRFWAAHGAEPVEHFDDVVRMADVYVCDNSSTIFEAAACGLDVVLLNAPWYRRHVEWGLRFWEWAGIGPNVDRPDQLEEAVEVAGAACYRLLRDEMIACVYHPVEGSARRAAEAINTYLLSEATYGDNHAPGPGGPAPA
jgi:hypothetical protein